MFIPLITSNWHYQRMCQLRQIRRRKAKDLPAETSKPEMDVCVNCGCETEYPKSLSIDQREHYIEGAGQLCKTCATKLNDKTL
jgi:hypothetical protein